MNNEVKCSTSEIQSRIIGDTSVVAFIGSIKPLRLGVASFVTFLEYRHFPPKSESAKQFELYKVKWEEMEYIIAVIPVSASDIANDLIKTLGLRARRGSPAVVRSGEQPAIFPIHGKNVFTLEYVEGHFAYSNDQELEHAALKAEQKAVQLELEKFLERG